MTFPFLTSARTKPLYREHKPARPPSSLPQHLLVGAEGEGLAASYLRSIGYEVRHRNVRMGRDELDIIAWDPVDQVLVFVEVKTRTEKSREGFHPEMTAAAQKRRNLRRAARRWVANHGFDGGYRIDLVCVQQGKVTNHFKELAWD